MASLQYESQYYYIILSPKFRCKCRVDSQHDGYVLKSGGVMTAIKTHLELVGAFQCAGGYDGNATVTCYTGEGCPEAAVAQFGGCGKADAKCTVPASQDGYILNVTGNSSESKTLRQLQDSLTLACDTNAGYEPQQKDVPPAVTNCWPRSGNCRKIY
jgi:hypothetical protein